MTNLKTFQIPPKGVEILNDQNTTRIQIQPSGKDYIIIGMISLISDIALLFILMGAAQENLGSFACIAIFGVFFLLSAFLIIDGILTSKSKFTMYIDDDKTLTMTMNRPIRASKPVTFDGHQKNHIYQSMYKSSKSGTQYYLHLKSEDGKQYDFPSLSSIQMIWLLYTISELYHQPPEPLGPIQAVSEIVNQLNCIKSDEPETSSHSDMESSGADETSDLEETSDAPEPSYAAGASYAESRPYSDNHYHSNSSDDSEYY